VAFLRFSRDKRGYELFSLVQAEQRGGGPLRARVLYAFRTPPNIKVGREPFDDETRRSLEQLYPGVGFNWRQITETPIPAADAIDWRERRRVIREAKQAQRKEEEQAPVAPGESASGRRRRRRRGRGRPAEAASPVSGTPGDLSGEARSSSQASDGGSEIPETTDRTTEPEPSS